MAFPPKGRGKPGNLQPPLAKIDHAMQAGLVVGKLALMNDQAGLILPFQNLRDDLVKRHNLNVNSGREKFQRQVGGRQLAGDQQFSCS